MEKRVAMCCWFCDKIDENPYFLDNLWFSDEAHFLFSGYVNSKNNIFWGLIPPEGCLQLSLHSIKYTPWVAISKHGITGPYIEVLQKFWTRLGWWRGFEKDGQWFWQDGATPHTSNETLQWFRQRFGDRLISQRCEIEWAANSPDLNPPYFYLWGYPKDNAYENNPQTIISGRMCSGYWQFREWNSCVFATLWGSSRAYNVKTMTQKLCWIQAWNFVQNLYIEWNLSTINIFFVCCTIVTFTKIFMGSIFIVSPSTYRRLKLAKFQRRAKGSREAAILIYRLVSKFLSMMLKSLGCWTIYRKLFFSTVA